MMEAQLLLTSPFSMELDLRDESFHNRVFLYLVCDR